VRPPFTFPRVDLERVPVGYGTSTILLGRTAATIAELCFALRGLVRNGSRIYRHAHAGRGSAPLMPLVIVAELACWVRRAVAEPPGHAIEESLWVLDADAVGRVWSRDTCCAWPFA
jgi:hypothetical protein